MTALSRHKAQHVLARHGVDIVRGDPDPHTLATVAASHGWLSSVERIDTQPGTTRYQALVWSPPMPSPRAVATITARRRASTAAEALALALASMLAQQERLGSC